MAAAVLVVLAVLSLVVLVLAMGLVATVGEKQLHTPMAIAHDGPRSGRPAQRVDVRAVDGTSITVPIGRRQVLLFTDHSLMDFEPLLAMLCAEDSDGGDDADRSETVVLGSADRTSAAMLEALELRVAAAVVPHEVYDRYRVRVMPYAVVVGADGRVVTSGLVNTPFQLRHLAQVGLAAEPASASGRPSGRPT